MSLSRFAVAIVSMNIISGTAFAQEAAPATDKTNTETATTSTTNNSTVKTIYPSPQRMGNLTIRPAPIRCIVSPCALIMQSLTQNKGRALADPCAPGWNQRIAITGGVNADFAKWGDRSANYMGENYQRASLNDAYVNLSAIVNDWTNVFMSLSFNNATINDPLTSTPKSHVAEFNTAYSHNLLGGSNYNFQLEQGYITIANFSWMPIYLQLGKQFQDFSRYAIHPITESMTQVMSKTLYPSFKIGFIYGGFNGAAYAFEEPLAKVNHTSRSLDYGFSIGYSGECRQFYIDAGAAYLYNLIGVNDVAYQVNQYNLNNPLFLPGGGFNQRINGVALYLDVLYRGLALSTRFTTATQRFNVNDLPKRGTADVDANGIPFENASGAQPSTGGIQLSYGFQILGAPQNIYLGYQASSEASALLLPHYRWSAGYIIETNCHTSVGVQWDNDRGYTSSSGGNGTTTNLVTIRAALKFS